MTLLTKPKTGGHIFLFDGVCGLCSKVVQFVLPKDPQGKFQFASLQSEFATEFLKQYNINPKDLNTFFVVADYELPTQRVLSKSDAAAFVLSNLGGVWSLISLIKYLPEPLRNWGYDLVATNRYKVFGKKDSCQLPNESTKDRFIEV
ncbi:thiol-disulfide oxidoreductase DCC family protein [soil metagenome]